MLTSLIWASVSPITTDVTVQAWGHWWGCDQPPPPPEAGRQLTPESPECDLGSRVLQPLTTDGSHNTTPPRYGQAASNRTHTSRYFKSNYTICLTSNSTTKLITRPSGLGLELGLQCASQRMIIISQSLCGPETATSEGGLISPTPTTLFTFLSSIGQILPSIKTFLQHSRSDAVSQLYFIK